ncbi:rubredoxin [Rhodamnia argentea]|uniref:Rubredoxin n=1 Tax=Rhodamnia argentea TaxID=178133 RepID=A0A8B8PKP8_9MYRT|nr:rubredoxin [Rhodamnia argentea]
MASATTRPTFSFHLSTNPRVVTHHHHHHSLATPCTPRKLHHLAARLNPPSQLRSIDVSKEDKPTSSQEPPAPTTPPSPPALEQEGPPPDDQGFDKRRLEEKFAVLNTGIYECRSCGYKYDESVGDPSYPIPPGMPFAQMPEDWRCPTCGAAKSFFQSKSVEIAGFAQNQQYGLGGNALTSGQKAVLIYGSLLFFFVLFLSGYFLQ